jgi:hypothetical protein
VLQGMAGKLDMREDAAANLKPDQPRAWSRSTGSSRSSWRSPGCRGTWPVRRNPERSV